MVRLERRSVVDGRARPGNKDRALRAPPTSGNDDVAALRARPIVRMTPTSVPPSTRQPVLVEQRDHRVVQHGAHPALPSLVHALRAADEYEDGTAAAQRGGVEDGGEDSAASDTRTNRGALPSAARPSTSPPRPTRFALAG